MKASELRLNRVRVKFCSAPIEDVDRAVREELERFRPQIREGMSIAIAVGSRGISEIDRVVKDAVAFFQQAGARPFIIPAMGSHGGATAEGQARVLADYGITEETMGAPIRSSMEVVSLGKLPENPVVELYMDKYAYEADKVFVINRVKPHTDFHGPHESGIVKMLVIGLGKQAQAIAVHNFLLPGLQKYIPAVAEEIIKTGRILGALALVEDGYERLSRVKGALAHEIMDVDSEMLAIARKQMAMLPFKKCDVLVVDWMGKNITGSGVDTNVMGRLRIEGEVRDEGPDISRLCILDLTEESHGNALGIGIADVVPKRLVEKIDWAATYENVLTSRFVERGFLPIVQENDRAVIDTALYTCGHVETDTVRFARVRDTLHLDTLYVSDAMLNDLSGNPAITVEERGLTLEFDEDGMLERW